MKSTFADSFHFMAVLNGKDAAHDRAMEAQSRLQGRLVTTEFVLLEVGDAYADPVDRPAFLELVDALSTNAMVSVVPASSDLVKAGIDLFRHRLDKSRTRTDCISFVVMQGHSITEALTSDRHFEQAGFVALLK